MDDPIRASKEHVLLKKKKNVLILPMGRISPGKFVIFPDKKKLK